MALNIEKIKEDTKRFNEELQKEFYENLPRARMSLIKDKALNHILCGTKYSKSEDIPARILNNWLKEGVIMIEEVDTGKVKRFTKLQCVWLNIVEEARKFGMSLEDLKVAYNEIMYSKIPYFNYLKMGVINAILSEQQILSLEIGGICTIRSLSTQKRFDELSRFKSPCLSLSLEFLMAKEFPKLNLDLKIDIEGLDEDKEKMLLLFLLKTGSYLNMKIYLDKTDVRYIEEAEAIIGNLELYEIVSKWKFDRIEILLEDGQEAVITNKN